MNELNQIITNRLKSKPHLRRKMAVVTEIIEDTSNAKVKVAFKKDPEKYQELTLLNKTHETLHKDDHVWIHYWNTISDGYIAIKVGLSKFNIIPYVIVRPMHVPTLIGDSYLFDKKNSKSLDINYSYSLGSESETYNYPEPSLGFSWTKLGVLYYFSSPYVIYGSKINGYNVISNMWINDIDDAYINGYLHSTVTIPYYIKATGEYDGVYDSNYEIGSRTFTYEAISNAVTVTVTDSIDGVSTYSFTFSNHNPRLYAFVIDLNWNEIDRVTQNVDPESTLGYRNGSLPTRYYFYANVFASFFNIRLVYRTSTDGQIYNNWSELTEIRLPGAKAIINSDNLSLSSIRTTPVQSQSN